MNEFKVLDKREEVNLTKEELRKYYDDLKKYYLSLKDSEFIHQVHKSVNPLIKLMSMIVTKRPINIISDELSMSGYNGPVIYACNHSNSRDMPLICQVAKKQYYVLAGDEISDDINGLLFKINGVVFIDRIDKSDRKRAFDRITEHAIKGRDILIFPEATWNVKPSLPMLPLFDGIIEIAKITGTPIVPLATEYELDKIHVKIGKPIFIKYDADLNKEKNNLRDIMASMRWEIWETMTQVNRSDIPDDYFDNYLNHIYTEYPKLDPEFEKLTEYKEYVTEEEVFEPVRKLAIVKKYNYNDINDTKK